MATSAPLMSLSNETTTSLGYRHPVTLAPESLSGRGEENRAWGSSVPPSAHLKERDSTKKSSIVLGCLALPNKYGPHGSPLSALWHQQSVTHRTFISQNRKQTKRIQGLCRGYAFQQSLSRAQGSLACFHPRVCDPLPHSVGPESRLIQFSFCSRCSGTSVPGVQEP